MRGFIRRWVDGPERPSDRGRRQHEVEGSRIGGCFDHRYGRSVRRHPRRGGRVRQRAVRYIVRARRRDKRRPQPLVLHARRRGGAPARMEGGHGFRRMVPRRRPPSQDHGHKGRDDRGHHPVCGMGRRSERHEDLVRHRRILGGRDPHMEVPGLARRLPDVPQPVQARLLHAGRPLRRCHRVHVRKHSRLLSGFRGLVRMELVRHRAEDVHRIGDDTCRFRGRPLLGLHDHFFGRTRTQGVDL